MDQKAHVSVANAITHYDLVIGGLVTYFFPTKALHFNKIYLCWGLFNPQDSNIHKLIPHTNKIIEYHKILPPYRTNQGLIYEKIIELIEFTLPRDRKK